MRHQVNEKRTRSTLRIELNQTCNVGSPDTVRNSAPTSHDYFNRRPRMNIQVKAGASAEMQRKDLRQ